MATDLYPFATVADLAARLKIDEPAPSSAEYLQLQALLNDASSELREITGQALNPGTSTVTIRTDRTGDGNFPAVPAREITSVTQDDEALTEDEYKFDAKQIRVKSCREVELEVTYDHGWEPIPDDLLRWTCVLAAAGLVAARSGNLGLAGGLSSIAIDDARATWATNVGEQGAGVSLPPHIEDRLRRNYGAAGITVEMR